MCVCVYVDVCMCMCMCVCVCVYVYVCMCVCGMWRVHRQVTVSEVNRVMGAPGLPFLDQLQSACSVGRNDVLRRLRQLPAAKLLRHSEQSVRPGRSLPGKPFPGKPEVEV